MDDLIARANINQFWLTPSIISRLDTIDQALLAIDEGVDSQFVYQTSTSYTAGVLIEFLENVKAGLIALVKRVLDIIGAFYRNSYKLFEKYRRHVIERLNSSSIKIVHQTYIYPSLDTYPFPITASNTYDRDVARLHDKIRSGTVTPSYIQREVTNCLHEFVNRVTGQYPRGVNLRDSVTENVLNKVRGNNGKIVEVIIDGDTIDEYFDSIRSYKAERAAVKETRDNIIDDYEVLKEQQAKVTKDPIDTIENQAKREGLTSNENRRDFVIHAESMYRDVHIEMMRLFNGYIDVYDAAFKALLSEMEAKVQDRQNCINEIFTSVGLFTSINKLNPTEGPKVVPYTPSIKT